MPLARRSAATAMAGTTWPAVPPAATTTLATPGTARSAPSACGRPPTLDDAQFASAGGPPAGDVEDQPHREQRRHQTAVAVGDEGQRHAGQRRQPHHREEVDRRLHQDQRGQTRNQKLAVVVLRFFGYLKPRVAEQREEA